MHQSYEVDDIIMPTSQVEKLRYGEIEYSQVLEYQVAELGFKLGSLTSESMYLITILNPHTKKKIITKFPHLVRVLL